jgi:hypothetical protein
VRARTFRDGGLLDYHLDLPYSGDDIVLYPHFTDPGDSGLVRQDLPWRRACPARLQNVLLLAPSKEYLSRLPYGKLPDRNDFKRFMGDARAGRNTGTRRWMKAVAWVMNFLDWPPTVASPSAC